MPLVGRFEHLANRPRSDEARPLLEKIASQVKPIMSKRGWKVGTLAEFLPADPSLLGNNMNAGQRINLRLRPPGNTATFYEYDQLVLVMLHELTHIEHGPHNAAFYKLLAELEEEYYDLKRKGYSGEGFHGAGNHLSGFRVPEHVGRKKGLDAAQKRLDVQKTIGRGGRLGGSTQVSGKSMKEVLADAAERRMRDDKACHPADAGHAEEIEREVKKAQEESVGIDASELEPPSASARTATAPTLPPGPSHAPTTAPDPLPIARSPVKPAGPPPVTKKPRVTGATGATGATGSTRPSSRSTVPPSPANNRPAPNSNGEWACPTCTLLNSPTSLACDACTTLRPGGGVTSAGWYCEFCGAGPRDMGYWSCAECGWVRKWG